MKIWIDADACPVVINEILYRAAERTGVQLTLVANQALQIPNSDSIDTLQVPRGFDAADDEIVKRLTAGDLVITSNIPRAAEVGVSLAPAGRGDLRPPAAVGCENAMETGEINAWSGHLGNCSCVAPGSGIVLRSTSSIPGLVPPASLQSSAASQAMKSSGSKITCVVPSRYGVFNVSRIL